MQIKELLTENKIYGVVGNSGSGKTSFINNIELSKDVGIVDYNKIECNLVSDQIEYYDRLYNYKIKELEPRKNEIIKMLEISERILNSSIYEISDSELTKVLLGSILLFNPEIIIIDEMLDTLDYKNKVKIMK
ncbi:MAG: ATP-binding cassette domain-containing protein, partial [Bacilli bacterium]|nr:ATP-binding cassette domain-containing protein [Bacilli bacterium]